MSPKCTAQCRDGSPCEAYAVRGEDKCRMHLGKKPDGSSHEGNGFAIKHGAYADRRTLYTDVFGDGERKLVREIFADYLEIYKRRYGEPGLGIKVELLAVSINMVAELHASNWCVDRPDEVDTGFPHVDREERVRILSGGDVTTVDRYKVSPAFEAQMSLSRETRLWIKDLGLLPSAGDDTDAEAADSPPDRDVVCEADPAELEDEARELLDELDLAE